MNNKRKNQTKKIENFINSFDEGFPDELRDLSRSARENLTEQKDYSFSDWETNPNAPQPIDFRGINKSSEWLSKSKKHILKTINELDDKYFDYLYEDYNHWFNEYEAGGSVSEKENQSKGFQVFNYTDNIFASPETFKDKKSANNFIKKFRDRFKIQGYYRDNRWNKIDPKDIELEVIPTGFKVFETGGKIAYETASNLLNDLFFEVNEFYTKWDNGETTDDETIKFIEKIKTMLNEKKMETGGKLSSKIIIPNYSETKTGSQQEIEKENIESMIFTKKLVSLLEKKNWDKKPGKNLDDLLESDEVKKLILKHYGKNYLDSSEIGNIDDTLMFTIGEHYNQEHKTNILRDKIYEHFTKILEMSEYDKGGKMSESNNEDEELVLLNENEDNTWSVEELFGKKRLIESGFNSVEEAENYATGLGYTPTLYKDADEFANDLGGAFGSGGKIKSKKDDLKEYIKNIAKTHNVDIQYGGYEEYDGENVFFVHYEKSKEKLVETKLNEWLKNSELPNSRVYVSTDDFSDKDHGYWTMVIEQMEDESEEQEYYDSYETVKPLYDLVKDFPGVTDLSEIDDPDDQGVLGENFSFNFDDAEVRIWYDPGYQEFTMSIDRGNTMEEDVVDEAELISFLKNKEEFAFGGVVKNKEDLKALRIALAYADEKSKPEIKNAITRLKGLYRYEWNKDKSQTELNLQIEVQSFTTKWNEPGKKFPGYVRLIFSRDLDERKSQLYVNENYYAKKVENDYKSIKKMTTKLVKYSIGFEEVDYYDDMTDVYTVPYIYMKKGMRKAKIELEEYGSIPKDWIENISITFEYTKQVKLFLRIINKMQGYLNAFEEKEMTKWLKSCLTFPGKSVSDPIGYGSHIQTEYDKDDYYNKGGKITDESLEVGQEYIDEDGHKMRITKITGNQIHSALKFTWDKKYEKNTPDSKSNWLKVLKENKFKLV